MTKYYNGGGTPQASGDAKLFIAEFLGGFPDDYEFVDIEDGGYITKGDPYWRFGEAGGDQVVEIGLWDDYRVKVSASGIQGWDEDGGEWVDLLTGGGGALNNYIHLQDQKPSGTSGGTFTQDVWQTRDFTVKITDQPDACTLDSNQFTLLAGTYRISAWALTHKTNRHKIKLYNISDTSDVIIGSNSFAGSNDNGDNLAVLDGIFTISTTKIFELQHKCQLTFADSGFGVAFTWGDIEVYADIQLWKLS